MNILNVFCIKEFNQDFFVEEALTVPYNKIGGKYYIINLTKSGYTTFEAIELISSFFHCEPFSIGYAGLKDEDAITSQKISLEVGVQPVIELIRNFNEIYVGEEKWMNLSLLGYSDQSISIGKLVGNSFCLNLRKISSCNIDKIKTRKKWRIFFPNYYDSQRFGLPGGPKINHLVGEALLNNDYVGALQLLRHVNVQEYSNIEDYMENPKQYFESIESRKLLFYYNSFSSFLFNNQLSQLLGDIKVCDMDIAKKCNVNMALSQNNKLSYGNWQEIERYTFDKNGDLLQKTSSREQIISVEIIVNRIEEDLGYNCVQVSFYLPSGCYATLAMKQFALEIMNI